MEDKLPTCMGVERASERAAQRGEDQEREAEGFGHVSLGELFPSKSKEVDWF